MPSFVKPDDLEYSTNRKKFSSITKHRIEVALMQPRIAIDPNQLWERILRAGILLRVEELMH